jgi:hypothetical protein
MSQVSQRDQLRDVMVFGSCRFCCFLSKPVLSPHLLYCSSVSFTFMPLGKASAAREEHARDDCDGECGREAASQGKQPCTRTGTSGAWGTSISCRPAVLRSTSNAAKAAACRPYRSSPHSPRVPNKVTARLFFEVSFSVSMRWLAAWAACHAPEKEVCLDLRGLPSEWLQPVGVPIGQFAGRLVRLLLRVHACFSVMGDLPATGLLSWAEKGRWRSGATTTGR